MKKIFFAIAAVMACFACSEEQPFSYRGLAFNMPTAQFVDSLISRGLVVDSAASDSGRLVVLNNAAEHYRVLVAYAGDKLQAIQENYQASTNDSTRMMWQQLRDGFEKELDCQLRYFYRLYLRCAAEYLPTNADGTVSTEERAEVKNNKETQLSLLI